MITNKNEQCDEKKAAKVARTAATKIDSRLGNFISMCVHTRGRERETKSRSRKTKIEKKM